MQTKQELRKSIERKADAEFRRRYHLKGDQVKVMRDTFKYQLFVLKLYFRELFNAVRG